MIFHAWAGEWWPFASVHSCISDIFCAIADRQRRESGFINLLIQ